MPLKVEMTASGRATRLTRRGSASTCSTIGDLSASSGGILVSLGHKLGLYKALAGAGPLTSQELADRADCAERYAREWLNAQVAGDYVQYHAVSSTYELSPEQAMVLADEDSPVFMPHAWSVQASMWFDEEKAAHAFRSGNGVGWGGTPGSRRHERRTTLTGNTA